VAGPTSADQVARLVGSAVALRDQVVEGDVKRIGVAEVGQAVDAAEIIPQIDGEPQVFADANAGVLVAAALAGLAGFAGVARHVSLLDSHVIMTIHRQKSRGGLIFSRPN